MKYYIKITRGIIPKLIRGFILYDKPLILLINKSTEGIDYKQYFGQVFPQGNITTVISDSACTADESSIHFHSLDERTRLD